MLYLSVLASQGAADSISLMPIFKTNNSLDINEDTITILTPGMYEIDGLVRLNSLADSVLVGIEITVNQESYGTDSLANIAEENDTVTLPIHAVIDAKLTTEAENIAIKFVAVGGPKIQSGLITIKKIS